MIRFTGAPLYGIGYNGKSGKAEVVRYTHTTDTNLIGYRCSLASNGTLRPQRLNKRHHKHMVFLTKDEAVAILAAQQGG